MLVVKARARANVALAKYWGKRDERLNLPCTGSISITLAGLESVAEVAAVEGADDVIELNGAAAAVRERERIVRFLDVVRQQARVSSRLRVSIESNFPVAAGLASSASTFAALALAAARFSELRLSPQELSALARRGSGSAARSIHGGFVEWRRGQADDGLDSHAVQLAPPEHWPLAIVVAVTDGGEKKVGSREGMAMAVKHSPFFGAWLETHGADVDAIRAGIAGRDLTLVGEVSEHNCLKMHAASMAAGPALIYWTPATLAVIREVQQLRSRGTEAYFTIDAGPQVKVICRPTDRDSVAEQLASVPGVQRILLSAPGPGAEVLPPP